MFKNTLLIILATIVLLIAMSYLLDSKKSIYETSENILYITINDKELKVKIADEPHEQNQGLSGRNKLSTNEGMLFVFTQPIIAGFWMKDMNFPLDFIWIDENLKIIEITKNISPETYPTVFNPPSPILYVLEVNAGWASTNKIKIGDKLEL